MNDELKIFKGYLESLEKYSNNIESFKKFKNDKRIKFSEKKLLECHLFIRANKNQHVLETLKDLHFDSAFFNAQKELLLGLAYNNMGQCLRAIEHFKASISHYENLKDESFIIFPISNLVFALENVNKFSLAAPYIKRLKNLNVSNPILHFHKYRCLSSESYFKKDYKQALRYLKDALAKLPSTSKHYESFVIIDFFNIYFQLKDYKACEKLIKESLKYRVFKNSDNYKFMKSLMDNYLYDTPLYVYKGDFARGSVLEDQILLIKSLSLGENQEAFEYWSQLQEKFPETYRDNLSYQGEVCLFSVILEKYKPTRQEKPINESVIINLTGTTIDKLIFIITNYSERFDKYQIIDFLWPQEEYSLHLEKRLNSLISKIRKNKNISITKVKGKYKHSA